MIYYQDRIKILYIKLSIANINNNIKYDDYLSINLNKKIFNFNGELSEYYFTRKSYNGYNIQENF